MESFYDIFSYVAIACVMFPFIGLLIAIAIDTSRLNRELDEIEKQKKNSQKTSAV